MNKLQAETILALAENGLNITKTAKATYRNRGTVQFHVDNIRKNTGKDPQDFYDMIELVKEARAVLGIGGTPWKN